MRRRHGNAYVPQRYASRECEDRKSTRLNSSHSQISYAAFCLKKKKSGTQRGDTGSLEGQDRITATPSDDYHSLPRLRTAPSVSCATPVDPAGQDLASDASNA